MFLPVGHKCWEDGPERDYQYVMIGGRIYVSLWDLANAQYPELEGFPKWIVEPVKGDWTLMETTRGIINIKPPRA